jgi:hypothetical protein
MHVTDSTYKAVVETLHSVLTDEVDTIALIPVLNTLVAAQITDLVIDEKHTAAKIEMTNHHQFMMKFISGDEIPTPQVTEAAEAAEAIGKKANRELKAKAAKKVAAA